VKVLPLFALLFAITGWILIGWTTVILLSGDDEGRTCYTDCVQMIFFSGLGAIVVALVVDGFALKYSDARALIYTGLGLAAPLGLIYATLILIGVLA